MTTERPEPAEGGSPDELVGDGASGRGATADEVDEDATAVGTEAVADPAAATGRPGRRRARRRASRAGTNPSADDAPDVVAPRTEPAPGETQHDRWLREQRPPHWE